MVDPRVIDPSQRIVARSQIPPEELEQAVDVLNALRRWREADARMRESSQLDMGMGPTDMRAMRYLIAAEGAGESVTAADVARHLGISTASTTKLIARLVASTHVIREPHPEDRRAILLRVNPESHRRLRESIGARHGRMFEVVAGMRPEERAAVLAFFTRMSEVLDGEAEADADGAPPPEVPGA